jgi:gliding motility-associated-like protein
MIQFRKTILIILFLFTLSIPDSFGQTTSYYARYSSPSRIFSAHRQIKTLDNGTLIVGKWSTVNQSDSADIMLIKLNEGGGVSWSKVIPISPRVENFAVCEMSDRSIALAADLQIWNNVVYRTEQVFMKFNCQGEVLWSNRLFINTGTERGSYPMSINEGKNGDMIFSCYSGHTGNVSSSASICRIDNTGNIVWSKTFRGPVPVTNTSTSYTAYAFYQNDKIFVFGYKNYYSNFINLNKQLYGMRLDYNTGTVELQQSYDYTEISTGGVIVTEPRIHFSAEQLSDNSFAMFGIFTHWTFSDFYYYKLIVNPDLSIKLSRGYVAPYYIGHVKSRISVFKNGETHISGSNYETETIYWYATDNTNNVIRQKKIKSNNNVFYGFGDFPYQTGPNRSAYCASFVTNTPPNYTYHIDQMQVENGDNSVLPCLGTDTAFVKQQAFSATVGTWNWVSVNDNEVSASPFPLSAASITVTASFLCGSGKSTGPLKITGPDTICNAANAYTYHVKTNNTLTSPIQWQMDPSHYNSFQQVDDSTISIVFKNTNSSFAARLYATRIGDACTTGKDSLDINVYPTNPPLPATVTVCTNPVDVHCGKWYKSYRWQDGSTDSVYTISQAGIYTVTLTTFCNEVINHTITAYSDKTGLKRKNTICIDDTLNLKAPEGLVNYSWTPAYNLERIADWEVNVYPQQDTSYFFSAETADGCQVKDTVEVVVNNHPVVSIGPDTTICNREDLTLQPNSSFAGYQWSNGATTPTIKIVEPGTYTLTVTDANKCTASDTVVVNGKICIYEFNVPNAFSPNQDGKNDIFKPHIKGRLERYELHVYNRWGQLVFRTNDAVTGWNGTTGSTVIAGTYVWMCKYQFASEPLKTARGTVTIIK